MSVTSLSSFEQEEDELFEDIDNEDDKKIEEFLKNKREIWKYKDKDNDDSTVLHIAVYKKLYKIVEMIINYCKQNNNDGLKQFINEQNKQGTTAIHFASFKGDVKIIELLIKNGADIYALTKRQLNVIHYACQGNKPTSLMYFYLKYFFFQKDADYKIINMIKAKDSGGSTPLHWAAYSSAEDILLYLIHLNIYQSENERLEFINQADKQGFTALHLSVSSKSIRIVMKLLQSGANAEIIDKKGNTPLKLAMNKNLKDIAEVLKNNKNCELCNVKAPVKQIKKSIKNIIYVFIAQTITTSFIFISVLAIAFNTSSYEKEKFVFYDILFVIYIASLFTFFLLYISLLWMDPGVIRAKSLTYLDKKIDKGAELNKYCYECYVEKTKDSRHCFICHKCYDNFDHHCYWINKCVAKNNYRIFISFLCETFIYLLLVLAIGILGLVHLIKDNNDKYIYNSSIGFTLESDCICGDKIFYYMLNIILIVMDLFFLIPETLLLILHLNIYCTNYRENKKKIKMPDPKNSDSSVETALMREDTKSLDNSDSAETG